MEKEFLSYEQALALKELGFNKPCISYFYNHKMHFNSPGVQDIGPSGELPIPTYSQAFRWFREKYDLHHVIHNFTALKGTDEEYLAEVGKADDTFLLCRTYEEAELACLEKLIEFVEQNV